MEQLRGVGYTDSGAADPAQPGSQDSYEVDIRPDWATPEATILQELSVDEASSGRLVMLPHRTPTSLLRGIIPFRGMAVPSTTHHPDLISVRGRRIVRWTTYIAILLMTMSVLLAGAGLGVGILLAAGVLVVWGTGAVAAYALAGDETLNPLLGTLLVVGGLGILVISALAVIS